MRGGQALRSYGTALRLDLLSHSPPRVNTLSHSWRPRSLRPRSRDFASMNLPPFNEVQFVGQSGANYTVIKTLQEDEFPPRRVYVASDPQDSRVILKYIHPVNYDYLVGEVYQRLQGKNARHLRLYKDVIPGKSMFVFEHFRGHLLELARQKLPISTTKRILKEALLGIAELHDSEIIHTDVKADNLADLEDAAHIPPGAAFIGKQAGNIMWRSPETHACGPIHKPSDIFSFAVVMIYAVTRHVIFDVPDSELDGGRIERLAAIIDRQMSYFGELDSVNALIGEHLEADNPYREVLRIHRDGFGKDHPRAPIRNWVELDDDFKDLVAKMTDFDPKRRITAREALAHAWFRDV